MAREVRVRREHPRETSQDVVRSREGVIVRSIVFVARTSRREHSPAEPAGRRPLRAVAVPTHRLLVVILFDDWRRRRNNLLDNMLDGGGTGNARGR